MSIYVPQVKVPQTVFNIYLWFSMLLLHWSLFSFFFLIYFIFKLYNIVLVLPNMEMNPPQVYLCSPSWTLLPPPSPYHPSGSSQCTSSKHPVSCIKPGLVTHFIHDIYMFQCHSPKSPHPSLSHRVHKTDLLFKHWFSQLSRSVMSYSLWPHEQQHARPPCPSPTPGA